MTSTPATPPVQPRKVKKSKANGPIVTLPKNKFPTSLGEYELLDEAAREKKEEVAQKTAEDEAKKKCPETNTKPDIFQSTAFLQDDKIIIVNYPKNKKEKDINDTLNTLNGIRKEGSTQEMPQAAIEALQRMLGKAPDQQRTRGSNYGKLDNNFTFPQRPQSTAGKSKETTKEENAASSSKMNEDAKESDDELEKKERARRRKSNLNADAPEFTPSFISSSSLTDANKSDSDQVEDRKKKSKKDKAIDEVESSTHHQRKIKKRPSQQLLTSDLDSATGSYGYASTYDQYYVPAPPTPYPVTYVENNFPNWDELQKNISVDVVNRVEAEVQKYFENIVSEVKAAFSEIRPELVNSSSSVSDNSDKRREEAEVKNESRLKEIQKQLHEFIYRHEEIQGRHLELQVELKKAKDEIQSASTFQLRHSELQNMHQNLQQIHHNELQKELSQLDELKSRLQEMLDEHRKMQDQQQKLHDEMTVSQNLQRRLDEIETELKQVRLKNTQLTNENTELTNEITKLSDENHSYKCKLQQESLTNDRERQLQGQVRDLQNEIQKLYEENSAFQQKQDRWLLTENDLNTKLRQSEIELTDSRKQCRDLEREYDQKLSDKEEEWQVKLKDTERRLNELQTEVSNGRILKENQEKLECESHILRQRNHELQDQIDAQRSQESMIKDKDLEIEKLNREITSLDNEFKTQVTELNAIHHLNQDLEKKVADLERACEENKDVELEHYRRQLKAQTEEINVLRLRGDNITDIEKLVHELEMKVGNQQNRNVELEQEAMQRNIELGRLRDANQALQVNITELTTKVEKNKIIAENSRLPMNANLQTASYNNHSVHNILDERRISRDQIVYSSPSISNNFDQSNYNDLIKPPNSYPLQTFSQAIPNNMTSQSSQPMQIMTSGVNIQHSQMYHSSMQHQPSINHIQHNQPPQGIQSVVPLQHQIPSIPPVVQLPPVTAHLSQQQQSVQASPQIQQQKLTIQVPQQMQTISQQQQYTPLMIQQPQFQQQVNHTSALPSPTTSQQGSLSHLSQQQNAKDNNKGHSRNNSRNYLSGNNTRQNKQGKSKKKKNSTSENYNQNINIDNTTNNSKTNASDSNDAPGKVWNRQPDELSSQTWWENKCH